MKRTLRIIGIVLLVVLVVGGVGVALWLRPHPADAAAQAAMQSSATLTVSTADSIITFMPNTPVKAGFIFYPGALVAPDAYAVKMRAIAEHGYAVFIVEMPLNLAILGSSRADEVIAKHPEITQWALGGHSLGGAMACSYLVNKPTSPIHALIFYASYCDQSFSLAGRENVEVTSLSGSKDGLATPQKVAETKQYAPADTTYVTIEGGNHAEFGNYGAQSGDNTADISDEQATTQIVDATVAALDKLTAN